MALALPPETIAIGCSPPRFALTASRSSSAASWMVQ